MLPEHCPSTVLHCAFDEFYTMSLLSSSRDDVAPFLECAAIERSSIVNKTPDEDVPMKNSAPPTTTPTTLAVKCNLEEMLVIAKDDNTPLRHTDVVWSESQEKQKGRQQEQAQKMMKLQGSDIASKGAAPGAVVVVQCSPTAVSHAIGIVGIIYEMSKYGGARVATIAGILSSGQKKKRRDNGGSHQINTL